MERADTYKIVDDNKFQVFLMACPASFPFIFALHCWFVCNKNGKLSRWEILFRKKQVKTNWNHLHLNYLRPFEGIEAFPFILKFHWKKIKLIGYMEGNRAKRVISFITDSKQKYPYTDKYNLLGPNSNTFVQWIIDNLPNSKLRLPWNAFGKNFEIKR